MVWSPNVPLVCCVKVAVYVVSVAGATMLCVCAPPSDHDEKTYVEPPIVCGEGALIEFVEPITACFVSGAAPAISLMPTFAPVGFEARVIVMICGSIRTLVVAVAPVESVAVSWISSQHGYSWSGALNVPLATPLNVWTMCVWQFVGVKQWCRIIVQLSREAGSVPSSGSVALPEKLIGSPTFHVKVDWGEEMVGTGGVCPVAVQIPGVRDRIAVGVARPAAVEVDGQRGRAARRARRGDGGRRAVRAQELDPVDRAAVEVGVEEVAARPRLEVDRARGAVLEERDLARIRKPVRPGLHEPDAAARVVLEEEPVVVRRRVRAARVEGQARDGRAAGRTAVTGDDARAVVVGEERRREEGASASLERRVERVVLVRRRGGSERVARAVREAAGVDVVPHRPGLVQVPHLRQVARAARDVAHPDRPCGDADWVREREVDPAPRAAGVDRDRARDAEERAGGAVRVRVDDRLDGLAPARRAQAREVARDLGHVPGGRGVARHLLEVLTGGVDRGVDG